MTEKLKPKRTPWRHYSGKLREQYPTLIHEIQDADGRPVVHWMGFDGLGISQAEITANCELLAASPELLKALRTIVRQMEGGHPVGHDAFLAARRVVNRLDKVAKTSPSDSST